MKKTLVTIAMVLVVTTFGMSQTAPAGNPAVIVVTGDAQIRVAPDEATVSIGIVRQAKTAAVAQEQANAVGREILAAITQAGIAANDIKTAGLRLSPMYEERSLPPRISGYQASNVVRVRVADLNKVGPVIDAGLRAGANEIQGLQFGLRDDLAARRQALKQAVTEARSKADAIAEAAGVQILGPLEISESGGFVPRVEYGGDMMMARAMAAPPPPAPVSPGELEIHAGVTIRYQIVKR